jgi:bacillithiol system protein YtxJ
MFDWKSLNSLSQYEELMQASDKKPFAVFKHSTRCSVSHMAKKKMEMEWNIDDASLNLYYLDLLEHRDISNKIANDTHITHQSPQLIVIKNKEAIYHESHGNIDVSDIKI